ncbi:MAG: hypothetical protein KGK08_14050 [Acidobacteriota bacterium]|nr:hypothetical protein [Acidobacteriota bacterium]
MRRLVILGLLIPSVAARAQQSDASAQTAESAPPSTPASTASIPQRMDFHIRYISGTSIYIDGGRSAGLAEGTQLVLKTDPNAPVDPSAAKPLEPGVLAKLNVLSVASTSAVCEVVASARELKVGDTISLPQTEVEKRQEKQMLGSTRSFPMIISFTEGDPLEEDIRTDEPRPPLPEINQARGRIGLDTSVIRGLSGNTTTASTLGMVVRADINRIHGTYWNLNGFWRGTLQNAATPSQPTMQDLINRTYLMSATYVNPNSQWTAGVGRLFVPWASSLETIDGAYVARHLTKATTAGLFGGSTPDPTAWNYNPHQQISGAFVNVRKGSFDSTMLSSTAGYGVQLLDWAVNRPFIFTENDLSYKRIFSIYHSMQIDKPTPNPSTPAISMGLGQSLLSVRAQVTRRVVLDLSDTYLRDVPTYDPQLVGTGLLDQYLYQGVNGGARVTLPLHITGYFTLGSSSNSSDPKSALNKLFGVTVANIWRTGLTADARYSVFSSAFASGTYQTVTLSRDLTDRLRLSLQAGKQSFSSNLTANPGSRFINVMLDTNLGAHYFFQGSYSTQRGGTEDYEQYIMTLGFRFDNRGAQRRAARAAHP